jgi:hypothetical protein
VQTTKLAAILVQTRGIVREAHTMVARLISKRFASLDFQKKIAN